MQATEGAMAAQPYLMLAVHWHFSKAFVCLNAGNPPSFRMGRDCHMSHDERPSPRPKDKEKSLRIHGEHGGENKVVLFQRDD